MAIIAIGFGHDVYGQSLPSGTCGIVYTYDAAGNRIKTEFVLNNTPVQASIPGMDTLAVAKQFTASVIKVDALYPNPTTGRITVRLVRPLRNAVVEIADAAGHTVISATANGLILNYDLSSFAAGIYFLYIQQQDAKTMMKIIKR